MKIKDKTTESATVHRYLKDLRKYPPISRKEEEETLRRARKGDPKAVERLVTANLRFVVSVASEYQGRGLPLSDLIAEGNMGLIEALKRFDPDRGYKFISYAVWWIHQSIQKALKQTATVSMPTNRQDDMNLIAQHWRQMTQELGRVPSLDEVSKDMKISRKRAERALGSVMPNLSLEAPLDAIGDNEQTLLQIIEADVPAPDVQVLEEDRREMVEQSLHSLDDRERKVIEAYFGIDGNDRKTLGEIGQELGITRERVRQIRNHSLDKLQRFFCRQDIDTLETWEDLI